MVVRRFFYLYARLSLPNPTTATARVGTKRTVRRAQIDRADIPTPAVPDGRLLHKSATVVFMTLLRIYAIREFDDYVSLSGTLSPTSAPPLVSRVANERFSRSFAIGRRSSATLSFYRYEYQLSSLLCS